MNKSKSGKSEKQFVRTQANKIERIEKELERNPSNKSAKQALEFWKTKGKRKKR